MKQPTFRKETVLRWYAAAREQWPHEFPEAAHARYQEWCLGQTEEPEALLALLRAALLKQLRRVCGSCTACGLHQARVRTRAVFDCGSLDADPFGRPGGPDPSLVPLGPVTAKLMVVGSHPGVFDARTGVPFTSLPVLAGSLCGLACRGYETCFPPESAQPQAPCAPVALSASEREALPVVRAREGGWVPSTPALVLDRALLSAGEWRESWNPRQTRLRRTAPTMQPRPGTLYLTTLVKCPSLDRQATPVELAACRKFLEIQLYIVRPKAIVALGKQAAAALAAVSLPVFEAPHPSWIAHLGAERQEKERERLVAQIRAARAVCEGQPAPMAAAERVPEPTATPEPPLLEPPEPFGPFDDPQQMTYLPTFADAEEARRVERGNRD